MNRTAPLNLPRAERVIDEEGLDGLLATTLENVYYLTNVWVENFVVLPHQTQFYAIAARAKLTAPLVVSGINELANVLGTAVPDADVVPFGVFYRFVQDPSGLNEIERGVKERVIDGLKSARPGPAEALAEALERLGLSRGRVAYDERGLLTTEVKAEVERRLPDLTLVPGYQTFRRIRCVKTDAEVQRLTDTLRLTERGIEAAMAIAREGITEREMMAEFERVVVTAGGRPVMTQVFFDGNGSTGFVRGREEHAVLRKGGVVRFDVGCILEGYFSDIARNYSLGEPAAGRRAIDYYNAVLAGETAAIDTMRPGVPASEVFHAGIRGARESGIPHYERNHIGHGIGLEMYDIPLLGPNDHTPLETGMVFEVETPYYELGFPGIQVEDTVVLRGHGAEILCQLDRAFQVVER